VALTVPSDQKKARFRFVHTGGSALLTARYLSSYGRHAEERLLARW
jgi:hypothetical protein